MDELTSLLLSWRIGAVVLLVFGLAPGFVLRLIALAYHRDDPRRREMIAELYAVPYRERPLWVAQQVEVAICEGLRDRIVWAATGRVIHRWHLVDGEQMNRDHPATFDIPTQADKAAIVPGDVVKAIFEMTDWGERMWLEVVAVKKRHLVCRLDCHPAGIPRLSYGHTVKVKPRHVVDILWHDVDYTEMFEQDRQRLAAVTSPFPPDLPRVCGCSECSDRWDEAD